MSIRPQLGEVPMLMIFAIIMTEGHRTGLFKLPVHYSCNFHSATMQTHDDLEPSVQIRELKKDRVNFVLKNVDLACVLEQL
jgi:hypothetical protein